MYEHVFHTFGLRENPFRFSPDPHFCFSTPAYEAALAGLIHSVDTSLGLMVLTGEAGTGKTTLLNHFLNWLRERQRSSAYVFHPRLKPAELFDCILRDFGVPCETMNKGHLLATLQQWLIRRHAIGDSPVVIIDEAQAMSVRTLDQLRLLLNLESAGNKLLQIVLAGQPELEEKLRRPELWHLHQRVTFRCNLLPFSMEETLQYVKSRLLCAGATNVDMFAQESLDATHSYARGIPRVVNLLCEHALITGHAGRVKIISPEIIERVAADFDLTPQPAAPVKRELSPRYARLVPLLAEERAIRVVLENAAVEGTNAEKIVVEPAAPGPLREVEPTLILEETISLARPAANPVNEPVAVVVPTLHLVVRRIAQQAEDPQHVPAKKLPGGWQAPSLGERFMHYWEKVRDSFTGDLKQVLHAQRSARAAASKRR